VSGPLLLHRVRAINTAPDAENKIHDDRIAAAYGFRGGLVPGVTVYGYMTVPIVEFAPEWLERGTMQVRLLEPFYDGDAVIVRAEVNDDRSIRVTAEREDGTACGTGAATTPAESGPPPNRYPEYPLPRMEERPAPSRDNLIPDSPLGTVIEKLDFSDDTRSRQAMLLQFSNEILVRNFRLGPWIHAASEITNWSTARHGDEISARGQVHDCFERKGHEFVVFDVMLIANGDRLVQTVRHTAIYRLRLAAP
jgi:acyl dehydratase